MAVIVFIICYFLFFYYSSIQKYFLYLIASLSEDAKINIINLLHKETYIMKITKLLTASLLVVFGFPLSIIAAEVPVNIGPDIIKLKMGDKFMNFQHWKHQKNNNNECFHCHKPQEWKIKKWDKEVAHEVCIACHDINDRGPVECKGCHAVK